MARDGWLNRSPPISCVPYQERNAIYNALEFIRVFFNRFQDIGEGWAFMVINRLRFFIRLFVGTQGLWVIQQKGFIFCEIRQARELFCRHCAELKFGRISKEIKAAISRWPQLTPGDFAVIIGQMGLRNITSLEDFLSALEAECALKPGQNIQIGFA